VGIHHTVGITNVLEDGHELNLMGLSLFVKVVGGFQILMKNLSIDILINGVHQNKTQQTKYKNRMNKNKISGLRTFARPLCEILKFKERLCFYA